jgi:alpha-L-arabinofuranosidase
MKSVDSNIQLVASGSSYYEKTGIWLDWNRKVLEGLGDKIDYLSIHRYWERSDDYYSYMGQSAMDFEEKIKVPAGQIEAARVKNGLKNPIYLSIDEWGLMSRNTLSVLPVAQCFNSFLRHADVVKMANFTLLTSLLGSDTKKGTFKTPLFYIFKAFANNCHGQSVDTYVACDTFNTPKFNNIPYLDVTTTYSKETNTVFINVVNRHKEKAITTDIVTSSGTIAGKAEASLIAGASLSEVYEFDKQDQYVPVKKVIDTKGKPFMYTFPPHSFTQIKMGVTVK